MRRRDFITMFGGAECRNESTELCGKHSFGMRVATDQIIKSQGSTQATRATTATATTAAATTTTAARRGDYVWIQS